MLLSFEQLLIGVLDMAAAWGAVQGWQRVEHWKDLPVHAPHDRQPLQLH